MFTLSYYNYQPWILFMLWDDWTRSVQIEAEATITAQILQFS